MSLGLDFPTLTLSYLLQLLARGRRNDIAGTSGPLSRGFVALSLPKWSQSHRRSAIVAPSSRSNQVLSRIPGTQPVDVELAGDELRAAIRAELAHRAAPLGVLLLAALLGNEVGVQQLTTLDTVADRRIGSSVIQVIARVPRHEWCFSFSPYHGTPCDRAIRVT